MTGDPISDTNFLISELIALAWVFGNVAIIIIGYYMRDRSQDEERIMKDLSSQPRRGDSVFDYSRRAEQLEANGIIEFIDWEENEVCVKYGRRERDTYTIDQFTERHNRGTFYWKLNEGGSVNQDELHRDPLGFGTKQGSS